MLNAIPATSLSHDPADPRLRFAIDRFLAGKISPIQLQSWCFGHMDIERVEGTNQQFWQLTMLNLEVFHRCDFHRSALEQSLTMLMRSMDATGSPCATPLTTSECWHNMMRNERRSNDFR